jgi:hypothetical protein
MQQEHPLEFPQRHAATSHHLARQTVQFSVEHRVDVGRKDPAAGKLFPVAAFLQKWLGAEDAGGVDHRLLERLLLEGVEGVVVDEDADRPLGRQIVGGVLDRPLDRRRPITDGVRRGPGVGARCVVHHGGEVLGWVEKSAGANGRAGRPAKVWQRRPKTSQLCPGDGLQSRKTLFLAAAACVRLPLSHPFM